MRVHYLQHVAFEGLGSIADCLKTPAHTLTSTHVYKNDPLPSPENFELLIIMGGPMGVHDEAAFPWLKAEKKLIKDAIEAHKAVLGICLGAQLVADVLGAKVYKNTAKEIGWWPIELNPAFQKTAFAKAFVMPNEVFHWHGDTFDLPQQAIPIARSAACKNQGFIYGDRIVALQFHLESTETTAQALIEHCQADLEDSTWVQSAGLIMQEPKKFNAINQQMAQLIEVLLEIAYQKN